MIASGHFNIGDSVVRVTAIQTGTITIKQCHHSCCLPQRAPLAARFAAILADRRWAAPLPIWTFLIEHPEGVFVVDAGVTPAFNDDASWLRDPRAGRLLRSFLKIEVAESETLPAQLAELGVSVEAVLGVVLTHQHIDHTGSVPSFPDADIWTTLVEDQAAGQTGANPWRWRSASTKMRHVDVEGSAHDDLERVGAAVDLVADGSLRAIHTPGHTPGSVSVLLRADEGEIWFTGDTSFTAASMDPTASTAGIHTDMGAVRNLHRQLQRRWLLLPSHDWSNGDRLEAAGCPTTGLA